jgi:hypothetical protein
MGLGMTRILMGLHLNIERHSVWQSQHRMATLEGFNFRHQHVLFPVDPLNGLQQSKLRPPHGFQLALLPTVST